MPHSEQADVPLLDITDPGLDFTSPEVAAAREASWYARTPAGLVVLRYAEVQEIIRDTRFRQDARFYFEMCGITSGPLYDWFIPVIRHQHGEDHLRLRRLVSKAFTPRVVSRLRPFIKATTDGLAEELAASGVCDFVSAFANQLPTFVSCQLLGLPAKNFDSFHRWSVDLGAVYNLLHDPNQRLVAENAVVGLGGYVDELIADRTESPADDLVSGLIRAQRDEGRISHVELRNLLIAIIFAAQDTVNHQISHAMVAFAAHPRQWIWLREHPESAPQAVDEVMRWCPAVATAYRLPIEDVDLHGVHIPRGTLVLLCYITAHRDPRVFERGESFDITLPAEAAHITFGGGPHYCLGAATARAELSEALISLSRRLGPPEIAGEVEWRGLLGINGPAKLPLRFT